MARLEWDLPGTKNYEFGVDRGVVYPDKGSGAAWVGLTSVDVRTEGGDVQPYYIDGFKYLNVAESTEFAASISAISTPPEFDICLGTKNISKGLYATNQWVKRFDFSYRTMVGEGGDDSKGYKLNLVYNALAKVGDRSYSSKTDVVDPTTRTIDIATVPVKAPGFKPTSRFVIDSRTSNPFVLGYLESILYGSNSRVPRMPSISEVLVLFGWTAPDVEYPLTFLGEGLNSPQTITNLITNPSFETASGTVEVYRNLATNPSFETSSGTIEVRRNLHTMPVAAIDGGGVPQGSTAYSSGTVSGTRSIEQGWAVMKPTSISAGGRFGIARNLSTQAASFAAGDKLRAKVNFREAPAEGLQWVLWVDYNGGMIINKSTTSSSIDVEVTVTAAGTALNYYVWLSPTGSTAWTGENVALGASWFLLEKNSSGGMAFNGGAFHGTPDPDLTPAWVGTPNNSESILTGVGIATYSTPGTIAFGIRSTRWKKSGAYSLRQIPRYSARGSAYTELANPGSPKGLVRGKKYTVLATLYQEALTAGAVRNISFITVGADVPTAQVIAQNIVGAQNLRLVFTVPNTGDWYLRLYNGGMIGDSETWWDDLAIVEGDYRGVYFDGSEPSKIRKNWLLNPSFDTWYDWSTGSHNLIEGRAIDVTSTSGVGNLLPYQSTPSITDVGEIWSAALSVSVPENYPEFRMNLAIIPYTKDGVAVAPFSYSDTKTIQPGTTERFGVVHDKLPSNVHAVRIIPYVQEGAKPGRRIVYSNSLLERAASVGDFFDGNSGNVSGGYKAAWEGAPAKSYSYIYDPDLTPSWLGTPNASESRLTAPGVAVWSPSINNGQGAVYQTTDKAMMIDHRGGSYTVGLLSVNGIAPAAPNFTYMFDVEALTDVTLTTFGEFSGASYRSYATHSLKAGERKTISAIATNPGGTTSTPRIYIGAHPPGPTVGAFSRVKVHSALVVDGVYEGPLFYGGQTVIYKKQQLLSKWTGTPDASTSTIEYQEFLPEETNIGDVYIINGYMYVFDSLGYWINLGEVPIT